MCALCGVLLSDHWAEQDGGRRGRVFRVALLNRVLEHFGLRLDDWAGRMYVLRDAKGRATVVDDIGAHLGRGGEAGRASARPALSGADREPWTLGPRLPSRWSQGSSGAGRRR